MWGQVRRIPASTYRGNFFKGITLRLLDAMEIEIVDISQVHMERLIRDVEEEEVMRLLKQVMENNVMLLNLQRQILELQVIKN